MIMKKKAMGKLLKKLAPLALTGALLLTGCSSTIMGRISDIANGLNDHIADGTNNIITADNGGTSNNVVATEPVLLSGDRGTALSLTDQGLEIARLGRETETPMGDSGVMTVFVYLCGTDLEDEDGSATSDILEMQDATENCPQLRFVVETDGTKNWHNNICKGRTKQRLLISGGSILEVYSGASSNMGSSQTLADFLSWGIENYSSQYMALDFWDHGGGSISGVCFDENYGSDSLSLEEIDIALASVYDKMTDRFQIISCDACLMSTVELANIFVPYTRYMVCSQELVSGSGWDYTSFADAVSAGEFTGDAVGRYICNGYYNSCLRTGEWDESTISVIDLSKVDSFLQAFNSYSKDIYEYAYGDGLNDVLKAAKSALNFGGNNKSEGYTNMVDLRDLISRTSSYSANAQNALELLDKCVVYIKSGSDFYNAGGLSVYYPLSVKGSNELDIFRNICVSPYYISLVDLCAYGSYSNGYTDDFNFDEWLNGDSGFWDFSWDFGDNDYDYDYWDSYDDDSNNFNFDYSNTAITFDIRPHLDSDGSYTFKLSKESLYNLDTVYCNLMMSYWDDEDNCEYMLDLGTDDYVDLDWYTGECSDNFSGYWFSLPDGQPLCVYLTDVYYNEDSGEYYNLYTAPVYLNDEFTYLRIKQSYYYSGMTTEILGAWDGISEYGSADRNMYKLQKGDRIAPCYYGYDAESGEYINDFYGDDYVYTGNPEIDEELLYEGYYYYAFEIYDLYDNSLYTDFVMFGVDEDGSLYYYD